MQIKKSLIDNLQTFFGFDNFKGDQEAIIDSILEQNDTFVIMPTGGGKSICYQLPALMSE
ncbi:MAG TPA: DEAD/DEAH box helicase, partial [Pelobium sp.]|nr:DEAD/DEAH box helicase [Pelobium sp.]